MRSAVIISWQNLAYLKIIAKFATENIDSMNSIIAENLRKLREAARYTQEEISQAIGITRSAYSNYESGDREAPYDVLERISDFFGCDMVMLFEENEHVDDLIFASAFRINGITPEDATEILHFKDIVKSYLKMEAIESK